MIKETKKESYAFVGTQSGVGVTYLAISCSIYFSNFCRKKVAIIEQNKNGHFNAIKKAAQISDTTGSFSLKGVDWYCSTTENVWVLLGQKQYDIILHDYGEFNQRREEEYIKADYCFIIGSLCEWKRDSYKRVFDFYHLFKEQSILLASLARKYDIRLFYKEFRVKLVAVPCVYDPFLLDKEIKKFWNQIIGM